MYLCKEGVTAVYQPKKDTEKAAVKLCVRGMYTWLIYIYEWKKKGSNLEMED